MALIEWEAAGFECSIRIEIEAAAHRIIRIAELLQRMSDIAQRN